MSRRDTASLAKDIIEERLRKAVREALGFGIGSAQIQAIVSEECIDEVDYVKGRTSLK